MAQFALSTSFRASVFMASYFRVRSGAWSCSVRSTPNSGSFGLVAARFFADPGAGSAASGVAEGFFAFFLAGGDAGEEGEEGASAPSDEDDDASCDGSNSEPDSEAEAEALRFASRGMRGGRGRATTRERVWARTRSRNVDLVFF